MRRHAMAYAAKTFKVSIHAPVKDATDINAVKSKKKVVSIHAPVKDATVHY